MLAGRAEPVDAALSGPSTGRGAEAGQGHEQAGGSPSTVRLPNGVVALETRRLAREPEADRAALEAGGASGAPVPVQELGEEARAGATTPPGSAAQLAPTTSGPTTSCRRGRVVAGRSAS